MLSTMPTIRKYFCFNLFTAGLVVGWIGLAVSIYQCILNILLLENTDSVVTPQNVPNATDISTVRELFVSALGFSIVLRIIDILACGMLIAGSITQNHFLLLPWLINSTVSLLYSSLVMILLLIYFVSVDYTLIILFNFAIIVAFSLYVYTFIAIYSLYCITRDGHRSNEFLRLIGDSNVGNPIYS